MSNNAEILEGYAQILVKKAERQKTTTLTIEIAKQMYESGNKSLMAFALLNFPELDRKPLPTKWEDVGRIEGWYHSGGQGAIFYTNTNLERNPNVVSIFKTEEQCKASIALAQLSQLMKVYNDGWEPDWNLDQIKYCICIDRGRPSICAQINVSRFLSFKSAELRDEFLNNFKDLIFQAKPLL